MILEALRRAWAEVRGGGAAAAPEPRSFRGVILAIVAAAFLVRALHAFEGLPYLHAWDEPFIVSKALDMMKKGTLDPEYFVYGSLPIYMSLGVSVAHYLWLMGRPEDSPPFLGHIDQITTYYDTGWLWEVSHPSFYLWSRWLAAFLGAGTVLLAYLIGRRLAGRWAGLLAALFLAGQAFHAMQSAIATVDNPMTFFAMLAAWGAVAFLQDRTTGCLVLSLAACGLAASCKYTAAPTVMMPVLALLFTARELPPARRSLAWACAPIVPALAFLAGTPYALLNMRTFLIDIGKAVRVYEATPWAQSAIDPGAQHLALQFGRIFAKVGPLPAALALAGLLVLCSKRSGLVLVGYGAVHALLMGFSRLSYPRNFLVLYPILAIAFGAGALVVLRGLGHSAEGGGRVWPSVRAGALLLVVGHPLYAAGRTGLAGVDACRRAESRSEAAGRLAALAKASPEARLAIPEEMKMHPDDVARIGAPVVEAPWIDLVCDVEGFTLAAAPVTWAAYAAPRRPWAEILDRLDLGGVAAREEIPGRDPLTIDAPSWSPGVEILTLDAARARSETPCLGRFTAREMEAGPGLSVNAAGELAMLQPGAARTGWILASPGEHAVVWEGRGVAAAGEPARIRLRVTGRLDGGEPAVLAEQVADLTGRIGPHLVVFDVTREGIVSAEAEFINDYYSAEKKLDRNAYVTKVYVLRLGARTDG